MQHWRCFLCSVWFLRFRDRRRPAKNSKWWTFLPLSSFRSLTCVNFPFAFSKSAWYFAFDWSFVFSAILLVSGVSAMVVAFAFGMWLESIKEEENQLTAQLHHHSCFHRAMSNYNNKIHLRRWFTQKWATKSNENKTQFTCTLRNMNVLCGSHNDAIHLKQAMTASNLRWIESVFDSARVFVKYESIERNKLVFIISTKILRRKSVEKFVSAVELNFFCKDSM